MKARYWAKQKVQTTFFVGRTGQQLCMVLGLRLAESQTNT